MWFWKFRKHKPKYRYSLKEKETYYTNLSKNGSGYLNLKNFDGNRYVESNRSYKLSSSQLYEHRGFGDNSNDYLTTDEKKFILKKRSNK